MRTQHGLQTHALGPGLSQGSSACPPLRGVSATCGLAAALFQISQPLFPSFANVQHAPLCHRDLCGMVGPSCLLDVLLYNPYFGASPRRLSYGPNHPKSFVSSSSSPMKYFCGSTGFTISCYISLDGKAIRADNLHFIFLSSISMPMSFLNSSKYCT